MVEIRKRTVSGFKWVFFGNYAQKAMSFISFIILARILEPRAFGLFAMAFIVIDGLNLFKNLGVDAALIQRKDNVEEAAQSAFWMMPIFGALIFVLLYFIAPFTADIMHEPALIPVVRWLGVIFLFGSAQSIPQALLSKQLRFKELEIRNIISSVVYYITAITLAFFGFGVWSLVYAYLTRRFLLLILTWTISDFRPRFTFNKKLALELLNFGKFMMGSSMLWFLITNMDNFFVGRLLGTEMLGFYALAYNISSLTTTHLAGLIGRVMYPAYTHLQDDKEAIVRVTLKIMKTLSLFSIPFGIVVIFFAGQIVELVYGAKWMPLVPVLKILAVTSILLPIISPMGSVFMACGKPKWSFYVSLMDVICMFIFIPVLASAYGISGAALGVTIAKTITIPIRFMLSKKLIDLGMVDFLKKIKPILVANMGFVLLAVLIKCGNANHYFFIKNVWILIGILVVLGGAYFGMVLVTDKQGLVDLKSVFKNA